MVTKEQVQTIFDNIEYRDWKFFLGDDNGRMYLQIHFLEPDVLTGIIDLQKSRKWMLSPYMTVTEIVRTAHKAIVTAVEHEVDENFKYKNERIYSPHTNVEALMIASRMVEVRK